MSKLDGNGRWQTKMIMPEYAEQYEARGMTVKPSRPSQEEYEMARDSIILPHMLTMVETSIADIQNSTNVLKRLHVAAGQAVSRQIHKDMQELRRELRQRNIKVIPDEQVDLVVYHKLIYRGYEERFGIVRDVLRSEISLRLTKYLKDIADLIGPYGK